MLVLMAIEDMLCDLGCTSITVAGNVGQALELVETESFDLATLDLNLNGIRSYAVAKALNAKAVPFVFSTGYGEYGVEKDYARHPVLNKPFDCSQLTKILTALLVRRGPAALTA